jgi:hypothetical protein
MAVRDYWFAFDPSPDDIDQPMTGRAEAGSVTEPDDGKAVPFSWAPPAVRNGN